MDHRTKLGALVSALVVGCSSAGGAKDASCARGYAGAACAQCDAGNGFVEFPAGSGTCIEEIAWGAPALATIAPAIVWTGAPDDRIVSDHAILLQGEGFLATPEVTFARILPNDSVSTDPADTFRSPRVEFLDRTTLRALVAAESAQMPAGPYRVRVLNPDGASCEWAPLELTTIAPPRITSISPASAPASATPLLTVSGSGFVGGAKAYLAAVAGDDPSAWVSIPFAGVTVTFESASSVSFTAPSVDAGDHALRIVNPDGQESTFLWYRAFNSSDGKLGPALADVPSLNHARTRHAGAANVDAFGNTWVYAIGGVGRSADSGPTAVLDSVEVARVRLGNALGDWRLARQMVRDWASGPVHDVNRVAASPNGGLRQGHAVARYGPHLYVLGGTTADTFVTTALVTAERTILRARVLGLEGRPAAPTITSLGGAGLPPGIWFYQVSSVCSDGESLPSDEAEARGAGRFRVSWSPIQCRDGSAARYNVYRSPAPDGRRGGTVALRATVAAPADVTAIALSTLEHVDLGRVRPAPGWLHATPFAAGGAGIGPGRWAYRVSAVVDGVETLAGYPATIDVASGDAVRLQWVPVPGATTYNVYRSRKDDVAGPLFFLVAVAVPALDDTSGADAVLDLDAAAPDGEPPLAPGDTSRWEQLRTQLREPREGAKAAVVMAPVDGDPTRAFPVLFVAGGRRSNAAGTADVLGTVEVGRIHPNTGDLCPLSIASCADAEGQELDFAATPIGSTAAMISRRAYLGLATTRADPDLERPAAALPAAVLSTCADADADGELDAACGGGDCDDSDPRVHPGAPEIAGDGIDQDCSGADLAGVPPWPEFPTFPATGPEHVLLIAGGGFASSGASVSGDSTFEIAEVLAGGKLDGFVEQSNRAVPGFLGWEMAAFEAGVPTFSGGIKPNHYLWAFGGSSFSTVGNVDLGGTSTTGRRPLWVEDVYCENDCTAGSLGCTCASIPADRAALLAGATSPGAFTLAPARCMFSLLRASGRLVFVGGNAGTGPTTNVQVVLAP